MRKEKLDEFNEWWYTGEVPEDLLEDYKRQLFFSVCQNLKKRQILSIVGLRRTGKTTIMYQMIDRLLQRDIEPEDILYFSFDETVEGLDEVISAYRDIQVRDFRKKRVYFFLDEVQKLRGWQDQIKKYYDLYPKTKFVISGSGSLFLGKLSKETLAGRIHEFYLPTLSFTEFLEFKGIKPKLYAPKIKPEFTDYIQRGGFPEVVTETNMKEVHRYMRSSVIDKIVWRDIPQISGIRHVEQAHQLLEAIAINPGMDISYPSLAQKFDADRRTMANYVMWLKESFLIRLLGNFRKGTAVLRKNRRAYLLDTGIISAFKPVTDEAFFGRMVENAVINALDAEAFWRNRSEVDAVVNSIPVEVKYQEKIIKTDLKGVKEFMRKFNVKKGFIITKDSEEMLEVEHGKIFLIPAWKLLLNPEVIETII
ncbi:MAG: ATP-binding protein [Thermoplasmata archaeon]|nr:MAG: ATP-binding protein [Thermoplasmata archaeon]